MNTSRGLFLSSVAATVAAGAMPAGAQSLEPVSVGILRVITDAPLLIAQSKGYFRDVGLNVTLTRFNSSAFMIAPLGVGQLDVGAGAPAAGLYNAVARGIDVKIVANKAIDSRGYGFDKVIVRKALIDSGKYKKPADLKGMNFGQPAKGSTVCAQAAEFLKTGGLDFMTDVKLVFIGFPDQVAAMQNGAIDATVAPEPWPTIMENKGVGKVVATDAEFYPDEEVADILYSSAFIKQRPAVAQKFMVAYIRALRYYHEALKGGHFAGKNADELVSILAKGLEMSPDLLRQITPNDVNPDGKVNVESLERDYAMFKKFGYVTKPVQPASLVDMRFVDAAVKQLGPYKASS
jgi:NitT/TauT family transport system substrate-binding protein